MPKHKFGYALQRHRTFPFLVLVGAEAMHGNILIYGLAVAVALHTSAHSRDERLQYAAKSWKRPSERNSTLEVDCATQLDAILI